MTTPPPTAPIASFLTRWQSAGGAERANYQLFLTELCDLLHVPHPDPATPDDSKNAYVFDRSITATNPDGSTATNFIDLYKRAHFVLETKQGIQKLDSHLAPGESPGACADVQPTRTVRLKKGHGTRGTKIWDDALLRAKSQAENYVRSIPDDNPPFLLVVDVGYQIETYADFSGLGKTYTPFPNNLAHRFKLTDLLDEKRGPEFFSRLQKIWTDPQSLNPAKHAAKVTREIAASLAELSKSLEKSGHHPEAVAHFLMRVLFTCFAEDVHLLGKKPEPFTNLLRSLRERPQNFAFSMQALWHDMDRGGFSGSIQEHILQFNGSLFKDTQALPLTSNQLELLIDAAEKDWSEVEPAIFGTLLERALDPTERHKLGAHYTPRAYVERLVLPTVIEPLREEWTAAKSAALELANSGDLKKAIKTVGEFLKHLCSVTILDPACGSGNFLYVTLEHLKRLEGEVNDFLHQFPNAQFPLEYTGLTVDPHQLRGIEINPRAAAITDLVLWIGYLQWHFRTHGNTMPQAPVLKKFDNIECRDAVLAYESKELLRDEHGKPISQWDGTTFKTNPVTGEEIPDEFARHPLFNYIKPEKAEWPNADYIVGNPPFIGNKRMRTVLGDGYAKALRAAWHDVPDVIDYVMYWWHQAACAIDTGKLKGFGLITTNSITQSFNRKITQEHIGKNSKTGLAFAIPDHPWVDSSDGAAVRIAMTVLAQKTDRGAVAKLVRELDADESGEIGVELAYSYGTINADLTIGANVDDVIALQSNKAIGYRGVTLVGDGFIVEPKQFPHSKILRKLVGARALLGKGDARFVIDFFGLEEDNARKRFPEEYQHLRDTVRPFRLQQKRELYAQQWWIFAEARPGFRTAIRGLSSYIGTVETSSHRWFTFVEPDALPEQTIVALAIADPFYLGVLNSRIHVTWSDAAGARLGAGNDPRYTIARCFDPFPFPDATEKQKSRIRAIAEELDAHRKRQQAKFPDLTLTDMYNILEKLRAADRPYSPRLAGGNLSNTTNAPSLPAPSPVIHAAAFSPKDKRIHDHGLISILKQLHDDLDAAVFDAYGWPSTLTDDQLLENLVALNHHRAAEEKQGIIKYLRPDFQNPRP